MARIDTRGSATLHITADEFDALREHVQAVAPNSELARVIAEAQPTAHPLIEPVTKTVPYKGPDLEDQGLNTPKTIEMQIGTLVYEYAITVPAHEQDVAAAALFAGGDEASAATVAENDPEVFV